MMSGTLAGPLHQHHQPLQKPGLCVGFGCGGESNARVYLRMRIMRGDARALSCIVVALVHACKAEGA